MLKSRRRSSGVKPGVLEEKTVSLPSLENKDNVNVTGGIINQKGNIDHSGGNDDTTTTTPIVGGGGNDDVNKDKIEEEDEEPLSPIVGYPISSSEDDDDQAASEDSSEQEEQNTPNTKQAKRRMRKRYRRYMQRYQDDVPKRLKLDVDVEEMIVSTSNTQELENITISPTAGGANDNDENVNPSTSEIPSVSRVPPTAAELKTGAGIDFKLASGKEVKISKEALKLANAAFASIVLSEVEVKLAKLAEDEKNEDAKLKNVPSTSTSKIDSDTQEEVRELMCAFLADEENGDADSDE